MQTPYTGCLKQSKATKLTTYVKSLKNSPDELRVPLKLNEIYLAQLFHDAQKDCEIFPGENGIHLYRN